MDNKLTSKQTALFCSIMLLGSKLLILPSLFYESNNFFGLFSLIILLVLEILFLFFLIKIKQKNKKINFFNIFFNKFGIFIAKIIFFILFLFFLFKLIYILQESFSFLKQTLYTEASILIYLVCMLPIITAITYKGLTAFGRTLELLYIIIIFCIVFCTIIWISSISNFSVSLFSSNGIYGFLESIYKYTFWFADFIFILVIIDNISYEKNANKVIMSYTIFTAILLVLFYFSFFYIYQTTSFLHSTAILDIIQFATNFGNVGRFDIFAITAIMFITYFQCGMYMFCAHKCLEKIFPFGHRAQSLILLNILSIVSIFAFNSNPTSLVLFFSNYINYLAIFAMYLIPILFFLFLIKIKNNKKIFKNNNKSNVFIKNN